MSTIEFHLLQILVLEGCIVLSIFVIDMIHPIHSRTPATICTFPHYQHYAAQFVARPCEASQASRRHPSFSFLAQSLPTSFAD
ncbi:uncharacterized protein EI97DRAFT_81854 [Westerdykella ornata]|uniref:Uncharacterized protein n=1 Tax=Westerdykella ornata TaxID=318751 RepID=A0A6A6JG42_WESOR|nr:uncharacterized protein EI97DRAFT_81854 [Westerdykella ornata]KAF2275235.1 hypothetical protein EI97DRAFT_81854 [Westerdykella ornata]